MDNVNIFIGIKMLWEAWKMKPNEGEETQREVHVVCFCAESDLSMHMLLFLSG